MTLPVSGGWHNEDCRVSLSGQCVIFEVPSIPESSRLVKLGISLPLSADISLSSSPLARHEIALWNPLETSSFVVNGYPDRISELRCRSTWPLQSPFASWLAGWHELALLTLVSFHCLLRPAEARNLRWEDLHCFDEQQRARYPGLFGLIGVALPKTRRLASTCVASARSGRVPWVGTAPASSTGPPGAKRSVADNLEPTAFSAFNAVLRNPATAWCAIAPHHAARASRRRRYRTPAAAAGYSRSPTPRPLDLRAHLGALCTGRSILPALAAIARGRHRKNQ